MFLLCHCYSGIEFGAVKLVPPSGWKPPFCLDLKTLKFKAREQLIHKLASGHAFKFPKAFWTAEQFHKVGSIRQSTNGSIRLYVYTPFIFHMNPLWLILYNESPFQHNDEFKSQYVSAFAAPIKTVEDFEIEYWRLVDTQTSPGTTRNS